MRAEGDMAVSKDSKGRGKDKDKEPDKEADPVVEPVPPPRSGRKKLILLAMPLVVGGIGAGLWFGGVLPRLLGKDHDQRQTAEAAPVAPVYIDLPEMVANLNGTQRRPSYVKLVARLEVAKPEDVERVKATLPRVLDLFQTYLREMRPEELRGAAGTYRLREELIARADIAVAPSRIVDVLFTEMLVQ
jgi:flagellar FliL protein